MKKFLELVAEDLLKTYGNNLSEVTVVLPGKRARLFMNQYLALQSDKPVWSPRYQTIDELFLELSPYRKAEQIETVCLLYNIYCEILRQSDQEPEPLDEFYSWGEIILSDFDDIDKHLAPADKVFANVRDLTAIQTDYLTDDQKRILASFFDNFNEYGESQLKERFLRLWDIMPDLYEGLRDELKSRGYLYSGALYRDVVERLKQPKGSDAELLAEKLKRTYAFVGFNVVDESEKALFGILGREHTRFYWDYDQMYVNKDQRITPDSNMDEIPGKSCWEAGLFLKDNLNMKGCGNRLPADCFDNLRHLKDITFVATSTDNAQARYIPEWIGQQLTEEENETAIVLCDEHLLQPVLHSLPEDKPRQINVTMGFPLTDTPIFSFLSLLMSLQIDGWDEVQQKFRKTFMDKLERHPYFACISGLLKDGTLQHHTDNLSLLHHLQEVISLIGNDLANKSQAQPEEQEENVEGKESIEPEKDGIIEPETDGKGEQEEEETEVDVYKQLYGESLFQVHKVLNRFITLIEEGTLDVHPITLRRLIRNVLGTTSIPFHGEPAVGMQVMGLMETRNLDFRHLLMLNVGEGTMPKKADDTSLIPYNLREAFHLTTIPHRISVFAYYFFRLLQRAEHVTLMYNENSSGVKSNEMSRFMRQLMAETDLPIRHIRLTPENKQTTDSMGIHAEKTPEILAYLKRHYSTHNLAPTAINAYLTCPLQFYFKYVAKMFVNKENADEISAAEMGTAFHNAAEAFYKPLLRQIISPEMLEPYVKDPSKLEPLIQIKGYDTSTGLPLVIRNVIRQYLVQLFNYDMKHAPFVVEDTEVVYDIKVDIAKEGEPPFVLKIGGTVDRLDRSKNGGYIVVDYKTGGLAESIDSIEGIFVHKAKNAGYYLQTILYAIAVSRKKGCAVQPTLFYVHRAYDAAGYDSSLSIKAGKGKSPEPILDVRAIEPEFMERLTMVLREMFNPDINFCQTSIEKHCEFCDYQKICGKQKKNFY